MPTPLARLVGDNNVRFYKAGDWIEVRGRITEAGWHVSVFPKKGQKGSLEFDEFHVTEELRQKGAANKHHFYSDEGYIQEDHLDTVEFTSTNWKIANKLAAEIYQKYLGLYVTAEMLDQQVKDLNTRGKVRRLNILSVEEYQKQQAEKAAQQELKQQKLKRQLEERKRSGKREKVIDMFASDSDEDSDEPAQPVETRTTTNTSQPITSVPSASPGSPASTGSSSGEKKRKVIEDQIEQPKKKIKTENQEDQ